MLSTNQAVAAAAALTLTGALWTGAQSTSAEPAKFAEWKKSYEKALKDSGEKAFLEYDRELARMEQECVAKLNYAAAAKIRAERTRAAAEMGIAVAGAPQETPETTDAADVYDGSVVTLEGEGAELGGGVTYDEGREALTGWISSKSFAKWKLPAGMNQGGYDVEIIFACPADAGGEVLFREDVHTLKRSIPDSTSWESYRTEIFGTLRISAGSTTFQVSAATVKGSGLFYLKSIRLLPSGSGSATQPP